MYKHRLLDLMIAERISPEALNEGSILMHDLHTYMSFTLRNVTHRNVTAKACQSAVKLKFE